MRVEHEAHALVEQVGLQRRASCEPSEDNTLHIGRAVENRKERNEIPEKVEKIWDVSLAMLRVLGKHAEAASSRRKMRCRRLLQ